MTSQKIRQYLNLTCKTHIPKLLFLIKYANLKKKWQSYSPVLLVLYICVPNLVSIGCHLTSYLTCATFNTATSRDIDLKFIQDTYRVVINSPKMTFIDQGSRSQGRHIAFLRYSHITKTEPYTSFKCFS